MSQQVLGRRKSGDSESHWLCAMTASACLADTSLLPLPASWNPVSQLQLPGSAQAPCSYRTVGYLGSTSQVFKVQGFKENPILFRSWPNSVFSG